MPPIHHFITILKIVNCGRYSKSIVLVEQTTSLLSLLIFRYYFLYFVDMNKILFILCSFLILNKLSSQIVFCPPGATWHYAFKYLSGPPLLGKIFNQKIQYVR